MTKQFTIIITKNPRHTNKKIKNNRENQITEKAPTYLITDTDHRILLKKPEAAELREYNADVVINETQHENLTQLAAKENGITVQKT